MKSVAVAWVRVPSLVAALFGLWAMAPGAVIGADAPTPSTTPSVSASAAAPGTASAEAGEANDDAEASSGDDKAACIVDPLAVQDLEKRRASLDDRQKALDARESDLKAREAALQDQLKKLAEARNDLETIDEARKKENDTKVAKLVETLEAMSPKATSALLASLDERLAVAAIDRMSTPKLAKVMNLMDAARASRLTEILAGVVRARRLTTSNDVAATTTQSAKGGDSKNGQNQ